MRVVYGCKVTLRREVAVGVAVAAGLALVLPAEALGRPLPSPPHVPTRSLSNPTASLQPEAFVSGNGS
jgi:hypothetical protein